MTSNKEVVEVQSQGIATSLICPICSKLLKNATTITECLHTFCRKCIHKKITEEEIDRCPVCNVYLDGSPMEKLRPDHNLEELRKAIFSSLRREEPKETESSTSDQLPTMREFKQPGVVPHVALPARRKEKSLASLVSLPKSSEKTVMAGRKNSAERKVHSSGGSSFSVEEPISQVESSTENPSHLGTMQQARQNTKQQNFLTGDSFEQRKGSKRAADRVEPLERMADPMKCFSCLVEAAEKLATSDVCHDEICVNKTKLKETAMAPEGSSVLPQSGVDATNTESYKGVAPIWLSLVASDVQKGDAPLPQIPSSYLRIKNVNLPVSFIQKYIRQKLDLESEVEVEVTLKGQPLLPTLPLHGLINLWLLKTPKSERIKTTVGSSAKDFVMVLHYGRKGSPP